MKANELRIGNYLKDKENRLCKVEKLDITDKYSDLCEIDAPAIIGGLTSLPVKPIPLTEEWHFKCNIELKTVIGESWQRRIIKNIEVPLWIEYVHDLQNWYYYTFEKKELELKQ